MPQYEGLLNITIKWFKMKLYLLFYREMCRFLYTFYGHEDLWGGKYTDWICPSRYCPSVEGTDMMISAFMFNKGVRNLDYDANEKPVTFYLNPDGGVPLRTLVDEDMMLYCFNGYALQKEVLPIMTIKGGFAYGEFAENMSAFVLDIFLIEKKKKKVLYSTSLPLVFQQEENKLGLSYYMWPDKYINEGIWNFNALYNTLHQYSQNVT